MKTNKTLIKELRVELRYGQMQARIDARCLKGSRDKCKQIGAKMTALANPKPLPPVEKS